MKQILRVGSIATPATESPDSRHGDLTTCGVQDLQLPEPTGPVMVLTAHSHQADLRAACMLPARKESWGW